MLKKNLPSIVTIASLGSGFLAIISILNQQYFLSAYLILIGVLLDHIDGQLARAFYTSKFGEELDSLADVVNAGVAPSILAYSAFFNSKGDPLVLAVLMLFLACSAIRLARFNVGRKREFKGLPTFIPAIIIATLVLLKIHVGSIILVPLFLLSLMMISQIHYPAFKAGRKVNITFSFCLSVVYLTSMFLFPILLLVGAFVYALFGHFIIGVKFKI